MHAPIRLAAAVLLLGAAACASAPRAAMPEPTDGAAVLRAMHQRYDGRWYRTLYFTQKTVRTLPNDSTVTEEWREWATIPGGLRIEMGPRAAGNGAIFRGDSVFHIRNGRPVARVKQRNPLAILGFDVYGQPPERSAEILREEGIDLSKLHVTEWQGRRTYVVGAAAGDLKSKQFLVDAERLVFVRLLEPFPQDASKTMDIRFDDYERLGGGWIAPRVEILLDGKIMMTEDYSDVKIDVPVGPAFFDPDRFMEAPTGPRS